MKSIEQLFEEHIHFTTSTFPDSTAESSLLHLKKEIDEVCSDISSPSPNLVTEYADCFGCLFDSIHRAGLTLSEVMEAFDVKLEINKNRKWVKNADNTYSHVKE